MRVYPPLEHRRALAEGYIDGCQSAGLDLSQFTRTSVDEVVFDMEVGVVMRVLWISLWIKRLDASQAFVETILREYCWKAYRVLARAKTDPRLHQKVLERGTHQVVPGGLSMAIRLAFWATCSQLCLWLPSRPRCLRKKS